MFGQIRIKTVLLRDAWIKKVSDLIAGIKLVKFYAWETPFAEVITKIREDEMRFLKKGAMLSALNNCLFFSSPAILGTITTLSFHYLGGELSPSIIFSIYTLLNTLRITMFADFPRGIRYLFESLVSLERVQAFLALNEIKLMASSLDELAGEEELPIIAVEKASFCWEGESETILKNISFDVKDGELVGLFGEVASGKSSIINALMGEMTLKSGKIRIDPSKRMAYVGQTPWIQAGTILQNILFGQPYDENWFAAVCSACALDVDLNNLPDHKMTLIGERGVTLSGGQRARIAIARAVYSRADIFLLDDPLSAVDLKVGTHIFKNCFCTLLKTKAVILITHQQRYLEGCDRLLRVSPKGFLQIESNLKPTVSFNSTSNTTGEEVEEDLPNQERAAIRNANPTDIT
jgi:ATP-binding cassette subfamily C (CFTR/MRP) protein 4